MSAGRLVYVSPTQIKLIPYNGNRLWTIEPTPHWMTIPSAGVTMSNAGFAANTNYYIYLWDNAGTLELYRNGLGRKHVADRFTGIEVDAQYPESHYPLVGMIRTGGSVDFADLPTARFVLSWANRRRLAASIVGTYGTATETTWVTLGGAVLGILTWGDTPVEMQLTAGAYCSDIGNVHAGIALDGDTTPSYGTILASYQLYPYAGYWCSHQGIRGTRDLSEGWHTLTAVGVSSTAGTATFNNPTLTAMPYG